MCGINYFSYRITELPLRINAEISTPLRCCTKCLSNNNYNYIGAIIFFFRIFLVLLFLSKFLY